MPAIAKTVIQEPVLMKGSNLFKIPKILADHYNCKKKKKKRSHDIKHQNYQSKETLSEKKPSHFNKKWSFAFIY
jgi:hypothetical protein